MIYQAYELLAKLNLLSLCGQNIEGQLEWIGSTKQWNKLAIEEEAILRDWDIKKEGRQEKLAMEREGDLEELKKDEFYDR